MAGGGRKNIGKKLTKAQLNNNKNTKNNQPNPKRQKVSSNNNNTSSPNQTNGGVFCNLTPTQRRRLLSSETSDMTEEAEVLLDTVLGALTATETIDRFVTALVAIPEVKAKLLQHLAPSLETELHDVIQPLTDKIDKLTSRQNESDLKLDDLEQYGRRHSVRINGVPETDRENTDFLVCDFLGNELGIEVDPIEIDRSHRLGPKSGNNPRPIAVKFLNYRLKEHVYSNRRHLRKGLYINESLTKARSKLFYQARQLKKQNIIKETWTKDGKIFIKQKDDSVSVCTRESDLPVSFATKTSMSIEVDDLPAAPRYRPPQQRHRSPKSPSVLIAPDVSSRKDNITPVQAVVHSPPDDKIEIIPESQS